MSALALIVEDDEDIRSALAEALTDRGFQVLAAANGREAIVAVAAAQLRPDVVLLDLMMPVMDGVAFLEHQSSELRLADVPVIIMSAQMRRPDPLPATVRMVLTKPVGIDDLVAIIIDVSGARPEPQPPSADERAYGGRAHAAQLSDLVVDATAPSPVAGPEGTVSTAADPPVDLPAAADAPPTSDPTSDA